MAGGMDRALARALGRPDTARGSALMGQGSTTVTRTGQGRVYQSGNTAVGLSSEAKLGSATGSFSLDTGTLSSAMLGGIVIGLFAWYVWTRSAQA